MDHFRKYSYTLSYLVWETSLVEQALTMLIDLSQKQKTAIRPWKTQQQFENYQSKHAGGPAGPPPC